MKTSNIRNRNGVVVLASLGMSLSLACSKTSDLELGPKFPEGEALTRIAASPVELQSNATASRRVPLWYLEQPLPSEVGVGPALGDSPGEQLLTALVAAVDPGFQIDEQMTCAAHQYAWYVARNGSGPTHALLRYMVHRCGGTSPTYGWAAEEMSSAPQLADVQRLLATSNARGRVGVWVAEKQGKWILAAFRSLPKATIEPLWVVLAVNPWQAEDAQSSVKATCGASTIELPLVGRHTEVFEVRGDQVTKK